MAQRNNITQRLDWISISLYFTLILLGWLNIYSAVYNSEQTGSFELASRYGRQLIWIGAAFAIMITALVIDSKFYSAFAYPIYGTIMFLLLIVLAMGTTVNGAKSWLVLGPIRFQPAEFAKLGAALAIAKFMSHYNFKPEKFKTMLLFGAIAFFPSVLILMQNDTGSALVFFTFFLVYYREGMPGTYLLIGIILVTLFVLSLLFETWVVILIIEFFAFLAYYITRRNPKETAIGAFILIIPTVALVVVDAFVFDHNYRNLAVIGPLALASIIYLIKFYKVRFKIGTVILAFVAGSILYSFSVDYVFHNVLEIHQRSRINHLLGIESDPYGAGYNVNQSMIAIGSGGPIGKGYLQGTQTKFKFVPEQSTDFIFCTVGEEWGFLGTLVVIGLFLALLMRIIILAERQKSKFSRIFGYSVASVLFFHVAINIGMTIGLAPVIGIPLPFFSYGGSSLWGFTFMLFIFLKLDTNRTELIT